MEMAEWKKGMGVKWETFGGNKYEGVIIEVDCNVLHVKCTDGVTRAVEA
jgi:hypothetical protein